MAFEDLKRKAREAATVQFDPFQDVERAQGLMRESVEGYGEQLRPHLMREIGNALGGLNSMGALRSGGATVALNDITQDYADRIGAYAQEATGRAMGYGMDATRFRSDRDMELRRQRDAKRAGLNRAVGSVLGAGIGFIVGGPAGAMAGAGMGGRAGGGYERRGDGWTPSERMRL